LKALEAPEPVTNPEPTSNKEIDDEVMNQLKANNFVANTTGESTKETCPSNVAEGNLLGFDDFVSSKVPATDGNTQENAKISPEKANVDSIVFDSIFSSDSGKSLFLFTTIHCKF